MTHQTSRSDGPREFEDRAIATARALHDPSGLQGARMILGRERDGVFIDHDSINAYEFTTSKMKAKSIKDASKLAEVLKYLKRPVENSFKSATGWLVTESEPTAEQREAVRSVARDEGITLHILSFQAMRSRLCNVEDYLACRTVAPFGSTAYTPENEKLKVEPKIHRRADGAEISVRSLADQVMSGERMLLVGEFGVGKSHSMREIYLELRKRYFRNPATSPFPVHLNLRDCAGLRSPSEVLRRHAEEIGFGNDRGLISAWRAGACVLLLDGFDEIIPSRWLGSATSLKEVRWEALAPIRRLVSEAPPSTGLIIAGRGHYFSSEDEMQDVLGLGSATNLTLHDFDSSQATKLLENFGSGLTLPDWLPTRPLLLIHLLRHGSIASVASIEAGLAPAEAWRELLSLICTREANIYSSVTPGTIRSVVQRLATAARTKGDPLAPMTRRDLEQVFFDVTGRSTDEEVLQLLLRLPGLATAAPTDAAESRVFADEDLAATAFGEDLCSYVFSPYGGHLLSEPAAWSDAASALAVEVCAAALREQGGSGSLVIAACDLRMDRHNYDAIMMDLIRTADELDVGETPKSFLVEGVLLRELSVGPESPTLSRTHIRDSVIELLDLSQVEKESQCPTIDRCLVDQAEGVASIPVTIQGRFPDTEISTFSAAGSTTSGILSLDMSNQDAVALSILHKVYAKRGRGRKESALSRGLTPSNQELVSDVVGRLTAAGLLTTARRGSNLIFLPTKGSYSAVHGWLDHPQTFHLDTAQGGETAS